MNSTAERNEPPEFKKNNSEHDTSSMNKSLHPIEKKLLLVLNGSVGNKSKNEDEDSLKINSDNKPEVTAEWFTESDLSISTGLTLDQIRRGVEWLKFKNLVDIISTNDFTISGNKNLISPSGQIELPERKLIEFVKKEGGNTKISTVMNTPGLFENEKELFGAIRYCKKNNWIQIKNDEIYLLPESAAKSADERFLTKLIQNENQITNTHATKSGSNNLSKTDEGILVSTLNSEDRLLYDNLKKRRNILLVNKITHKKFKISNYGAKILDKLVTDKKNVARSISVDDLISGRWKELEFEQIDVEAPLPLLNYGKKNPLIDFIDEVKEILIGMGFNEIDGDLIQSCFWNFDALFIPQDHSAREMQDTFYIHSKEGLKNRIPEDEYLIDKVAQVHRSNWHYDWKKSDSLPFVLRTHTTPVTIQYLLHNKPEKAKVFSIGRVFRNEKVSYKHLIEFHQVEGVYTHENANLRELIGIQSEFYSKLGIKKVKFWPTFFPYTEPSLQSMIYNEKMDKWIELFGMGIFRPEVTKPLGINNPVLAWGGGFERLAMLKFELKDIRDLYSNNLSWLIKGVPKCQW